ncbi:MAG: hypothetical protein ACK5HS_01145 [Mycoplasmatales bacterium]
MNDNENINFKNQNRPQFNFNFQNLKFTVKHKIILSLLVLLILAFIVFFQMPVLNPIYKQSLALFFLVIAIFVAIFIKNKTKVVYILAIYFVLMFLIVFLTSPIFSSQKYYNMLGEIKTYDYETNPPKIDDSLVPVVDEQLAQNLGDKKLGENIGLGSQFQPGEYYLVSTSTDLAWVSPLEPRSFIKWLENMEGTPGYIYVSATNPNDVRLVTDNKIKYSKGSYFFNNIRRYAYLHGNLSTGLTDFSFEVDDNLNPYWVITTYAPSFNIWAGNQATGAVVVNATNGEINKYSLKEDNMPDWIERVQPTQFLIDQINYWGAYKNGWFNTIFGQKEMIKTTKGYSFVNIDSKPYLYTGLTSIQSDESTVGFMLVNLRTKESFFYTLNGATETAAMSSAEGQVQQYGYSSSFPILLNIYGEPTYFMPLKDKQGLIKQYAFVSVSNYNIVGIGNSYSKAKDDYYDKLKSNGSVSTNKEDTIELSGKISRINYISDTYYIMIEGNKELFTIKDNVSKYLKLTQVGDNVKFSYLKSDDTYKEIVKFNNETLA